MHDYLPFYVNITPHAINKMNVDRAHRIITISNIAPREGIDISYLDYTPYSTQAYLAYDQGVAKHVPFSITVAPKKWLIALVYILALVGLAVLIYFLWFKVPSACQLAQVLITKVKAIKH